MARTIYDKLTRATDPAVRDEKLPHPAGSPESWPRPD